MSHRIVWISSKLSPKEEWQLRCLITPYLIRKWPEGPIGLGPIGGTFDSRSESPTPPGEPIPFIGGGINGSIFCPPR